MNKANQKSFLFDMNKCTGCGACVIACSIERSANAAEGCESPVPLRKNWRQVYTFNESRHPALPVFNLSLACNHCAEPLCLHNCPALAYSKDEETGIVTINPDKCMGCKYCTWACPYDAPKYEPSLGITRKCDFCEKRIAESKEPACVASCPMGALQFESIVSSNELASGEPATRAGDKGKVGKRLDYKEKMKLNKSFCGGPGGDFFKKSPLAAGGKKIAGFTDAGIEPAIRFIPLRRDEQPECTAPPAAESIDTLFASSLEVPVSKITLKAEWALLFFTTITYILVAFLTASLIRGPAVNPFLFLGSGAAAMGLTFVHLGQKFRAFRAILNWSSSWLSREILFFSAFMGLSGLYLLFFSGVSILGWAAAVIGFTSLLSIDKIYQVALQCGPFNFHSAHVLFNGFFLLGVLIQDIFLTGIFGSIKLFLYLYRKYLFKKSLRSIRPFVSVLRLSFGFIFPIVLILLVLPGINNYILITISIIIGELIDRGEYYEELDVITPQKQLLKDLQVMLGKREEN